MPIYEPGPDDVLGGSNQNARDAAKRKMAEDYQDDSDNTEDDSEGA
jgi:hypothetical protein